ncbi:non-ribosomal peptide synthetase [Legionella quateirensis]|uniref:Non-ribosomal peptide synthetase/polyketide synthetase n=1 Tax=Legionella quateirensis TaxID=45072 RepID=A0A378KZS2_9GAMM|nr:non-ribosomal peptide synthetase [Legionella quateirensis]KTD43672.1 non-ribosomal peptide synthetase/polyketide synthetase [Legionella quateirensis]STY17340.1 non-ribosomal peptide synthetase/polyketide synthetase [Legionella quateirensis]
MAYEYFEQKHDLAQSFELSIGQKELWFIHSMGGCAQSAYNEPLIYTLEGYLPINVLKKAFTLLMQKHDILRTSFNTDDEGNLLQSVHQSASLDFHLVELNDEEEITAYINQEIAKPFNLMNASAMRVSLIKKNESEHVLVIVLHHIITDGTSFSILVDDLNTFYSQIMRGEVQEELTRTSFYTHVLFEQENYATADYQEQVEQVAEQLKSYSGLNFLTTPSSQQKDIYSGNRVYFTLENELYEQMICFSKAHRATVFHVLYSVYALLISHYTRSNDVVIGVPFANRESDLEKEIIGYFINTMPVRLVLEEQNSFLDLVIKVKSLIFAYLSRQSVSFEHIAPKLNLERRAAGQHPLIQTLFVWGSTDKLQLSFDGINAQLQQHYDTKTSKFDVSLFMLEEKKEVIGYFEYRDCLFDRELIEQFATSFKILLKNILNSPEQVLGSFSLLDDGRKQHMKERFFTAKLGREVTQSLGELFSQTASHYPKNIGLVFGTNRYDYETIDKKSNQWASYIRAKYKQLYNQELVSDTLIALCVDRNEDMIFGMLGILKAGAAYVPVDPQYPQERINYIINHSKASLLLTHKKQDALNLEFSTTHTIYMDDTSIAVSPDFVNRALNHRVNPKDIAYVLYTSGSTGKPKGVAVTHENVNCLFASLDKQFNLNNNDVWSLFHTFCFDISVWEIWGAFLYGGSLIVIPYEVTRDTKQFYDLIAAEQVTVLTQTASAFQLFINEDLRSNKKLESLRYVGFVGESLKVSILRPWVEKYGTEQPRLANLYGITETTVYTNYKFVTQQDIDKGRDNIGWPLEEFSMCVLDHNNEWCPVGIVGEICIGGRGLSRGYLYRDDLTKEKFFPDPYASYLGLPEGALLYRTGDLGRWMEDGSIEYLGRKDFQIKLRGFRIELGEIEAALGSFDGITHTVVLLKGVGDSAYLAAYYTTKPGVAIENNALMAHLKSFLPDYMVPKIVTELPSFPMTVNGKIDRNVLNQRHDIPTSTQAIIPLRSQLEHEIAAIWAGILKVPLDVIGSSSNFFELGGNSLLVVKMLTQLNNKLKMDFLLGRFIAAPTIATLSAQTDTHYDTTKDVREFCDRLDNDRVLAENIRPLKETNPNILNPKNILITGVTGFLGAHMLFELLNTTEAQIYCLIRASSKEEALHRIVMKQKHYKLVPAHSNRIIPVLGDLNQPQLGLSEHDFEFLAKEIDSIMHVGAWVHHIYDYSLLYHSNVQSVKEALKLAVSVKNKALHFVSTLAAGVISPVKRLPGLSPDSIEAQLSFNGYLTTKWVAEQLLKEANERGIVAHVYRPGNIIAGINGIYEPGDNHTLLRLKGLLQLEKGFIGSQEQVEMMPVDLLSQAIINLSQRPNLFSYNLNNIKTILWSDYLQLAKNFGFCFQALDDEEQWNNIINNLDEDNALYKLSHFYKIRTNARETDLESTTIAPDYEIITPSYQEMIEQQFHSLITSGFLEKPQRMDCTKAVIEPEVMSYDV